MLNHFEKLVTFTLIFKVQLGFKLHNFGLIKIEQFRILAFNLNYLLIIYMSQTGLQTGDLDLDLQGLTGLETYK